MGRFANITYLHLNYPNRTEMNSEGEQYACGSS